MIFGTTNLAKYSRVRAILSSLPLEVISLQDARISIDVPENHNTPLENAIAKAKAYYQLSQLPTFSIDSGLYIDKFPVDKQPGVHVRRQKNGLLSLLIAARTSCYSSSSMPSSATLKPLDSTCARSLLCPQTSGLV